MRNIFLVIVLSLVPIGIYSQNIKKFKYEKNKFGAIAVIPNFDQPVYNGKSGTATFDDPYYLRDLFDEKIKGIVTKAKVDSLHTPPTYILVINSNGEILNCRFSVNSRDVNVFSADDFINLYTAIRNTRIDTSKFKIIGPDQKSKADYSFVPGTLLPIHLWNSFKR
jgi:hypothetical protein